MPVHELYPYLRVKNAAQAIDFYKQVFGASENFRLVEPGGRIGHAELDFDGSALMLSDEFPEYSIRSPQVARVFPRPPLPQVARVVRTDCPLL
ncbi:MAG: VOC family protein [Steroidobacteraceae bacterium]